MSPQHFEQFILPGLKTVVQAVKDAGGTIVSENQGVRAVIKEPLMVFAIHSVILHSLFAWDCFCLISSRREIIIRCAWGDPAPCMDSVK